MSKAIKILLVGSHPDAVDYSKWPGLTREKLQAALDTDKNTFESLGYATELGLIQSEQTAESLLLSLLQEKPRDCILIGAGIRTDAAYQSLFERLINTVHEHAPNARICFNSGPYDSLEAVQRWAP
ncbi:hypothetical protein [Pseudomonas fildesensis]|uniref:LmbE family protein n=1 Tax=Pseudomonas fildesensis TaxID=1674920 RepID=A0A0J8FRT5_9PSED|nr:hypothetical protein [Pseudomonas fildesensis]KMT52962.1 hypothetical protein ACR52_25370 [Pseudomonas fildesensis]